MPVVNPGIRRFLGSAIQRLFNGASFSAPLTHSAIPTRAASGTTGTFVRATTSTWPNNDGNQVTGVAGEIGFVGARRVRNLLTFTEDFSNAAWVKAGNVVAAPTVTANQTTDPNGDLTADKIAFPAVSGVNALSVAYQLYGMVTMTQLGSVYLKGEVGGEVVYLMITNGVTFYKETCTLTTDWQRFDVVTPALTAFVSYVQIGVDLRDATQSAKSAQTIYAWGAQLEDVTAQTTQTAGEYVSVGALDYRSELNPLYLSLPGTAGHYASTPDSAANSITSNFTGIALASATDWTPPAGKPIFGKRASGNSYQHVIDTAGKIHLYWWDATVLKELVSSVALPATDGQPLWLKYEVSFSAGTATGDFYYAVNNGDPNTIPSFTALGTQQTVASNGIDDTASQLECGADGAGGIWAGNIYRALLYKAGVLVVDFNPHRDATTPTGTITSSTTGEVWTINGASSVIRSDYYHGSFVDDVKCFPTDIAGNAIPSTTLLGYLAQGARTNLSFPSQDDSAAGWFKNDCTVAAPSFTAPDGTATASKLVETATGNPHYINKILTNSAGVVTFSRYLKKGERDWGWIYIESSAVAIAYFNLNTGVKGTVSGSGSPSSTITSVGNGWYRCTLTATVGLNSNVGVGTATADNTISHAGDITKGIYTWGSMAEAAPFASSYIATTTIAVARNSDVESVSTSGNIAAAAGSVYLEYTPTHSPSGTIALWGTYVDASNYTAILHDATNLIFRKRIAGSNYDATIANAFVSGTTYKVAATWGAAGTAIYLDGVAGTPHANTTAAQIAATMQVGADGNSLQQPGAGTTNLRIWQRQLSSPEGVAVTA